MHSHDLTVGSSTHGSGAGLDAAATVSLRQGLSELLRLTEGLTFRPLVSERYPLPLALAVCGCVPEPERVREQTSMRAADDVVAALDPALVLFELYQCAQPETVENVPDDSQFLSEAFRTKRSNGWVALLGGGDRSHVESALNGRWQFSFVPGRGRLAGLYTMLNMLVRYGLVYGRIEPGDAHALAHFLEDYAPGLLVCWGALEPLERMLALG